MEKNSEKYHKLIKLAQKFDACQNDLLHYQKKEIMETWNHDNSDLPSDDSSSMLNIKKVNKKIKRNKSCVANNTTKQNYRRGLAKPMPLNQKPITAKLKATDFVAANKKAAIGGTDYPQGKHSALFPIDRSIRKSYSYALNNQGFRNISSNHNRRNSSCSTRNILHINKRNNSTNATVKKKFKLKKFTCSNRASQMKETKKEKGTTKRENYRQVERQANKKKSKTKKEKNTFLKKKLATCSSTDITTHKKEMKSNEKCSQLSKEQNTKRNYFIRLKKKKCLKKKKRKSLLRKTLSTKKYFDCNTSLNSTSAFLEDTLNHVSLLKIEETEQTPLSLSENMKKQTNSPIPCWNHSEHTYIYNRERLSSENTETPKRNIFPQKKGNEKYTTSEFININTDEEPKTVPSATDEQHTRKHKDINQAHLKYNSNPKEKAYSSDNSNVFNYNNTKIKNKNERNDSVKEETRNLSESMNSPISKNGTYDVNFNHENTHTSVQDNATSERKFKMFSKTETPEKYNPINIKSFKKLLKALNESFLSAVTKKHQKQKNKKMKTLLVNM